MLCPPPPGKPCWVSLVALQGLKDPGLVWLRGWPPKLSPVSVAARLKNLSSLEVETGLQASQKNQVAVFSQESHSH